MSKIRSFYFLVPYRNILNVNNSNNLEFFDGNYYQIFDYGTVDEKNAFLRFAIPLIIKRYFSDEATLTEASLSQIYSNDRNRVENRFGFERFNQFCVLKFDCLASSITNLTTLPEMFFQSVVTGVSSVGSRQDWIRKSPDVVVADILTLDQLKKNSPYTNDNPALSPKVKNALIGTAIGFGICCTAGLIAGFFWPGFVAAIGIAGAVGIVTAIVVVVTTISATIGVKSTRPVEKSFDTTYQQQTWHTMLNHLLLREGVEKPTWSYNVPAITKQNTDKIIASSDNNSQISKHAINTNHLKNK